MAYRGRRSRGSVLILTAPEASRHCSPAARHIKSASAHPSIISHYDLPLQRQLEQRTPDLLPIGNTMGYTVELTTWPATPLSEQTKQLLESLFVSLDDSSDSGGNRLAEEVFTPDGIMVSSHPAKGSVGEIPSASGGLQSTHLQTKEINWHPRNSRSSQKCVVSHHEASPRNSESLRR